MNDPVLKDTGKGKKLIINNSAGWADTVLWSPSHTLARVSCISVNSGLGLDDRWRVGIPPDTSRLSKPSFDPDAVKPLFFSSQNSTKFQVRQRRHGLRQVRLRRVGRLHARHARAAGGLGRLHDPHPGEAVEGDFSSLRRVCAPNIVRRPRLVSTRLYTLRGSAFQTMDRILFYK